MDGLTASTVIRNQLNVKTPILALTANVLKGVIEKCEEAGMSGYISKPFNPDDVYQKMLSLLNLGKPPKDNPDLEIEDAEASEPLMELETLTRMLRGDQEQVNRMLRKFIQVTPEYMEHLMNAYHENDFEGVEVFAHKLKSSIDLIGNTEMREIIRQIHEYCKVWDQVHILHTLIPDFKKRYDLLLRQLGREVEKRVH